MVVDTIPSVAELFSLDGKVAIVTGATGGIGLSTARLLSSAGAITVIAGLPEHDPVGVATAHADEGRRLLGVECDVTDGRQLADLVARIVGRFGRIDVVVANAGASLEEGPHLTATDAALQRMLDLHLFSVLHLAQRTLPLMADQGGGAFVVISSIAGLRGNARLGSYGITKAANAQLARNLAVQWGAQNIRVNAVSPGVIDTDFARGIIDDAGAAAARLAKTPLRRFGVPAHVAGTVLWLVSDAGAFTSGQNIVVDGGTLISD